MRGLGAGSPANIMKHLKKLHFPADRETILSHAGKGPGPATQHVLDSLMRIPDKEYRSTIEIVREIGRN